MAGKPTYLGLLNVVAVTEWRAHQYLGKLSLIHIYQLPRPDSVCDAEACELARIRFLTAKQLGSLITKKGTRRTCRYLLLLRGRTSVLNIDGRAIDS